MDLSDTREGLYWQLYTHVITQKKDFGRILLIGKNKIPGLPQTNNCKGTHRKDVVLTAQGMLMASPDRHTMQVCGEAKWQTPRVKNDFLIIF